MSEQPITIDNRGAVEVVSLNRPDRLNAMSQGLIAALHEKWFGAKADASTTTVMVADMPKAK